MHSSKEQVLMFHASMGPVEFWEWEPMVKGVGFRVFKFVVIPVTELLCFPIPETV